MFNSLFREVFVWDTLGCQGQGQIHVLVVQRWISKMNFRNKIITKILDGEGKDSFSDIVGFLLPKRLSSHILKTSFGVEIKQSQLQPEEKKKMWAFVEASSQPYAHHLCVNTFPSGNFGHTATKKGKNLSRTGPVGMTEQNFQC